jgi:hypothetical protein
MDSLEDINPQNRRSFRDNLLPFAHSFLSVPRKSAYNRAWTHDFHLASQQPMTAVCLRTSGNDRGC